MDRRALHSHGIAAGSRARRESGPGARQWRSSLLVLGQQCPGEAACTTQRPAAGLHQGTWLPGSNLVPRGSGLLLAEGHLRGRPAGLGEHQHTLMALGPSPGSSVPSGKSQSMAMFLFAPQREKIKNNCCPHRSPTASSSYDVMLLLSLLSCRM